MTSTKPRWTKAQQRYVIKYIHDKPRPQIAKDIGKSELALDLWLHRHRNDPKLSPKKNLLIQLLQKKFRDITCFSPTRSFLDYVKIGQKRYWAIYKGKEQITEEELKRITEWLEVSLEGIYEARQIELWTE